MSRFSRAWFVRWCTAISSMVYERPHILYRISDFVFRIMVLPYDMILSVKTWSSYLNFQSLHTLKVQRTSIILLNCQLTFYRVILIPFSCICSALSKRIDKWYTAWRYCMKILPQIFVYSLLYIGTFDSYK